MALSRQELEHIIHQLKDESRSLKRQLEEQGISNERTGEIIGFEDSQLRSSRIFLEDLTEDDMGAVKAFQSIWEGGPTIATHQSEPRS